MTDYQWLKQHITNPSEDEIYFFVERVGIILDSEHSSSNSMVEMARKQAFDELKLHDF
jgi:hypothetical protein